MRYKFQSRTFNYTRKCKKWNVRSLNGNYCQIKSKSICACKVILGKYYKMYFVENSLVL